MIYSGTDLTSVARIEKSLENPRFLTRVFSSAEIALFKARGMKPETIAANWAAKEAFSKAMGTGFRGFTMNEVSVLRNELGAPYLVLEGRASSLARIKGRHFSVSLAHDSGLALAFVVGYDNK